MRVITHGDNLIQLTRLFAFNCFLVSEDAGFTLVDTSMQGSAPAIMQAAHEHGAAIQRIALTHAHVDHVGSLDALHALLPDAPVVISARDARFLTGDHSLDPDEPQSPLRGGYPICATTPDILLADGDRIGSLEVIASPGHTPGHVAFFDHRDGTLIAGDAFSTQAGISTGGTLRLLFPFPALATWDKQTAIRSAQRLRDLQPRRLAVGHGPVLENPVPAMEQAIAEAKRQVESRDHAAQKTY